MDLKETVSKDVDRNHTDHNKEQVYQRRLQMGSFPSAVRYSFIEFFVYQLSNTNFRSTTRNSLRTNISTQIIYHVNYR
jgi:hypothetical protein